jgi:hypothetical protein
MRGLHHKRHQEDSHATEQRHQRFHPCEKICPNCIRVYRYFERINGKKIRRKVLGMFKKIPARDDWKRF